MSSEIKILKDPGNLSIHNYKKMEQFDIVHNEKENTWTFNGRIDLTLQEIGAIYYHLQNTAEFHNYKFDEGLDFNG